MITWYSTMRLPSTRTSCSFTHALRTFRSVAVALWMPCWIASSKLFSDVALISVILATDTSLSFRDRLSGFWHPVMPVSTEMSQPSKNLQIERSRNVLLTDSGLGARTGARWGKKSGPAEVLHEASQQQIT